MTLNPSKCTFGYQEVKVLGHTVSAKGVSPDAGKIKDILNFEPPRRLRALRSISGACQLLPHKQDAYNVVPDTLSRNACEDCKPEDEDKTNEIPMLALNWTDLPKLQDEDEECRRIKDTMLKPEESTATERRMARSFMLEDGVL
ncbi:uncharacterized protein LOC124370104 [Homalodisca vitripennis]|uniref:uncharacterized protein LOC124370104 n=1 Tax=Homalodisca vitripennis TaxID=197043 RepID=UPI001EEA3565|nr:uncharacterized protein LOC124370104 [Homalodisca vitripennis]